MQINVFLLSDQLWVELPLNPTLVLPGVVLVEAVQLLIMMELSWKDNTSLWSLGFKVPWLTSHSHFLEVGVKTLGGSVLHGILGTLHSVLSRPVFHLVLVLEVLVDLVSDQGLVFRLKVLYEFLLLCFLCSHQRISKLVLLLGDEGDSHLVDLGMLIGEGLAVRNKVLLNGWVKLTPSKVLVDLVPLVIELYLVLSSSTVPDVFLSLLSVFSNDGPLLVPSGFWSSILIEVTVLVWLLHHQVFDVLVLN